MSAAASLPPERRCRLAVMSSISAFPQKPFVARMEEFAVGRSAQPDVVEYRRLFAAAVRAALQPPLDIGTSDQPDSVARCAPFPEESGGDCIVGVDRVVNLSGPRNTNADGRIMRPPSFQ